MPFTPCLTIPVSVDGRVGPICLGHPLLDDYLAFVAARARPNTLRAVAYDLKVFFSVVGKEPAEVAARTCSRSWPSNAGPAGPGGAAGGRRVRAFRADDRSSVVERVRAVRVPGGPGGHRGAAQPGSAQPGGASPRRPARRGVPLIRTPRTLPRVLAPARGRRAAWRRCARTATGPWSRRCCWVGCDAARCSGCGSTMSTPVSGGCSSPRARAAGSGSCRSRRGSSPRSAPTWTRSGRATSGPSGCSWC